LRRDVRFFLDHDVDVAVGRALRRAGHECWTAADAGLFRDSDDALTVYAGNRRAVLVTHDHEFSERRRLNVTGHHLYLRCAEWDAADLLLSHLDQIVRLFQRRADLYVRLSANGAVETSQQWH
jgi:predicted nuclease of predicted toxin-antitoxin system